MYIYIYIYIYTYIYIHHFLRDSVLALLYVFGINSRHTDAVYFFGPVILWKMEETASFKEGRTIFLEMENNSMETPKNISHVM